MEIKITQLDKVQLCIEAMMNFINSNIQNVEKISIYVARGEKSEIIPTSSILPLYVDIRVDNRELGFSYSAHERTVLNPETFKLIEGSELNLYKEEQGKSFPKFISKPELKDYMLRKFPQIKDPDFYNIEGFYTDKDIVSIVKPIYTKISANNLDHELPVSTNISHKHKI